MNDHKWAWKIEDDTTLRVATKDYLRRGDWQAERILDSDLKLFKVVDIREIGRAAILGWRPGFKGTYLCVETVLQLDQTLSLEAAKRYVLDFVASHPRVYESGIPIDELSATVMAAASPEELLAAL